MDFSGLHHVTAVTANAKQNLAFYTNVLGLRLVKKTVNQDDVSAYHLFYGDERGHAGTEVTFFDWAGMAPNMPGAGDISEIGLRVPDREALAYWVGRFDELGVEHAGIEEFAGHPTLRFRDPEGQRLALVSGGSDAEFSPWSKSPVPAEHQIRGLSHVGITVSRLEPTERTLLEVLGFRKVGEFPSLEHPAVKTHLYESRAGGPGTEVRVDARPELRPAQLGSGGVHHVAFRTPDADYEAWADRLRQLRVPSSGPVDRFYFRSLYFREPNGILFEIASDGPGFTADEPLNSLGEGLALPPFLEPRRKEIEAGLKPLV